jgi:hypothetical protein
MVASARQFSSYIVLLGSISSATTFEPKFAVMLQNKDELTIPLLLETIPNAKQFRDSIDSLSPEQQRFAKAYPHDAAGVHAVRHRAPADEAASGSGAADEAR